MRNFKNNLKFLDNSKSANLLVFILLLFYSIANAATITSTASGGIWSAGTSWVGGVAPVAADNAIIAAGATITVTASTSISNLNLSATNSRLIVNTTFTLTITGTFANSGTTTNGLNGPGTVAFSGTASVNAFTPTGTSPSMVVNSTGNVTITAATRIGNLNLNNASSKLIINSGQSLTVNGTFTNSGTTTNGVNGPGTIAFSGTASVNNFTASGTLPSVVVNSTGIVTVTAATTITNINLNSGNSRLTINNGQTLTVNGTFANSGTSGNGVNGPGTIAFSGTASVNAFTPTGTPPSVVVNATGNVTITAATIIATLNLNNATSKLTINSGQTLTVNGTFANSGTTTNGVNGPGTIAFSGTASVNNFTTAGTAPSLVVNSTGIVTLTAATTITNINLNNASSKLTISSGQTLTVNGTFANSGTTTNGVNGPGTLLFRGTATIGVLTPTGSYPNVTVGDGITTNTVTLGANNSIVNNITISANAIFSVNTRSPFTVKGVYINSGSTTATTGRIVFEGNFTNAGTLSFSACAIQFAGTATQSISGFTTTGTISMLKTSGSATFLGNVSGGALTINGSGGTLNAGVGLSHLITGTFTRTNGTLNCNTSNIEFRGSTSGSGGTFTANLADIYFSRNNNQNPLPPVVYKNLTLGTGGTKTFASSPTINGILTIKGTSVIDVSGTPVITYGPNATLIYDTVTSRNVGATDEWITPFVASGGVIIANIGTITSTTSKIFNSTAPLTVNLNAKLGLGNVLLTLNGDFINNGTATGTTGGVTITGTANQNIGAFTTTGTVTMSKTGGTATFTGNVNGAALTINGMGGTLNLGTALTNTFTGNVTLTNGTLNGGSSLLRVNSSTTTAWNGISTNFTAGTSTVNFGGVAQTLVAASTFYNLTFSNSGLKTLTGIPTINNVLSMEGTTTVSAAPNYGASATLQYNRAIAQTAGTEWISTFTATGGVSIINTGAINVNAIKTFNSNVPLSIGANATLENGGFSIAGGSTITVVNTGTLNLNGTSTFPSFTNTLLGAFSTVGYAGTSQTVEVRIYGNLNLSGSGNKTFAGATTIANKLDISGTTVALLADSTSSSASLISFGGVSQNTGSWGGTTSVATNTNAIRFGSTTTGIIINSACDIGFWIGSVSSDWSASANWCGGVIPSLTTDVIISTATNQPVLSGSSQCKNITILNTGTLSLGSSTLNVSGNWTLSGGTFNPGTGVVNFNGTSNQTIGGSAITAFNDLTNSNTSANLTATNNLTVNGTLNLNTNSTFDLSTFNLSAGGSFSNTGTGKLSVSSTSSTPIPSAKTWNSSVVFNRTIGGQNVVAGTYNGIPSLEINNTSGAQIASGNIVIGDELRMNNVANAKLDMNGFNLTVNKLNLNPTAVLDINTGNLVYSTIIALDGTLRFSGLTNALAIPSGTIEYYGSNQTVTSGTYNDILFSGTEATYTVSSDIQINDSLEMTNGNLTVQNGIAIVLENDITINSPATLTLENNANLVQNSDLGVNTGDIFVKRNSTPMILDDYTFWSSPTSGPQTLENFSPLTDYGRFFTYDNAYSYCEPLTDVFQKGIGYVIRTPEGIDDTIPSLQSFQFTGVPNNSDVDVAVTYLGAAPPNPISNKLIGNPYPCALDADEFINANIEGAGTINQTISGTLYFWTHNNSYLGNSYSASDYATYNLSGGAGVSTGTGNTTEPNQFIASGQGFFVHTKATGNVSFRNSMKANADNSNFYRTSNYANSTQTLEKHRIWLNLTNANSVNFSQALIGYIEGATNAYDPGYDGLYFGNNQHSIYSILNNETYTIQALALPFENTNIVPLGITTTESGSTTIAIDHVDGLFLESQPIYLEDLLLNVTHDIKTAPYIFESGIGTFNNRFLLRFDNSPLSTMSQNKPNDVIIYAKNGEIKIESAIENIEKVSVYDVLGRQIFNQNDVNDKNLKITTLKENQTLILKITIATGEVISKKIINQ